MELVIYAPEQRRGHLWQSPSFGTPLRTTDTSQCRSFDTG